MEWLEDRTLLNGHTLATSSPVHFSGNNTASASGFLASSKDVDLFALNLRAGETVTAAVDAQKVGSGLDSLLRVFNRNGTQIAFNNDFDGRDPRLTFQAPQPGTYYVGVSAVGNMSYDPNVALSGDGSSSGLYALKLSRTMAPLLPDLVGASFQIVQQSASWGDLITIHYTIENRGGAAAGPFRVGLRLSEASTGDANAGASVPLSFSLGAGTPNERFVDHVYVDLLQRHAEPAGLAGWVALLEQGHSRSEIVRAIADSPERHAREVQGFYTLYLQRPAESTALGNWVAFLSAGATANTLRGLITGSPEYFQTRGGGTIEGFLDALYHDALNRALDPSGRAVFTQALSTGLATRTQVAEAIFGSAEYHQDLVRSFYQQYLGRGPDEGGLRFFLGAVQGGAREEQVVAALVGSDEYLEKVIDNSHVLLSALPVAGLAAGAATTGDFTVTLPGSPGNPPGSFKEPEEVFLGLQIDPDNQVVESNKNNNSGQHRGSDWDSLAILIPGSVHKPDSTTATATSLPLNSRTSGTLRAAEADFFKINPIESGRLTAQVHTSGLHTRLSLFDSTGRPLIQSDGQSPTNADDRIEQHLAGSAGTTYFLKVEGLGAGGGTYTLTTEFVPAAVPFQAIPAGNTPVELVTGDFNGDGNPDLAVVSIGSNDVAVFLGNGDGTFQAPVRYAVGTNPFAVVAADFRGDGHVDLATANHGSDDVSVLLGNGDGTFRKELRYAAGLGPTSLAVGDFGNGHASLATLDNDATDVSVLVGNGDGTFQKAVPYGLGLVGKASDDPFFGKTGAIIVADFRGSQILDLAIATGSADKVSVLLGNGDGTFHEPQQRALPRGSYPISLAAGRFRGPHMDLAVADRDSSNVTLLFGNGDGTFEESSVRPAVGTHPISIAAGDLTGNSTFALVTANAGSGDVSVLLGNGDGTFQQFMSDQVPGNGTPSALSSVTIGDYNNDGILDLAFTNGGNRTVGAFLGNGDATFQLQPSFVLGNSPVAIVAGDFRRNGILDLVTANSFNNHQPADVSILFGLGDGTFQNPVHISLGDTPLIGPVSLVTGDFNGDGSLDLAIAGAGSDRVSVLLGRGDGTFQKAKQFHVGARPTAIVAGDFNGDGFLDLATANSGEGDVSVLFGKGDGTFSETLDEGGSPVRAKVGVTPYSLVAGDFNGDGTLDLATANAGSDDVSILLGKGNGTFGTMASYPVGSGPVMDDAFRNQGSIIAGDFLGTGKLDLVVGNGSTKALSVLFGKGDGTFEAPKHIPVGARPTSLVAGDFNGDGHLDLATVNIGSKDISVLLGRGPKDKPFQTEERFSLGGNPNSLVAGDFAGNGRVSLATANMGTDDISVLLGQGDGRFISPVKFGVGSTPVAVATGDFRGIGIRDLVTVNTDGDNVSVLLGQGDGTFRDQVEYPVGVHPVAVVVGDFNRDGRLDLAVANQASQSISVLLGLGDGTFAPQMQVPLGIHPVALVAGDFTGTGILDLAAASDISDDVSVLLGLGDGTFRSPRRYGVGGRPFALVEGDFNGDGKLDLATRNGDTNDVSVLLGRGDGTFQGLAHYPIPMRPGEDLPLSAIESVGHLPSSLANESLVVGDFDGDGTQDLATVVGYNSTRIAVLLGQKNGTFRDPEITDFGTVATALATADFNRDGHADLALTNVLGFTTTVVLGNGDGTFRVGKAAHLGVGASPSSLVVGDFNGDGQLDFATPNVNSTNVSVLLGQGDGKTFDASGTTSNTVRSIPLIVDPRQDGASGVAILNRGGEILFRSQTKEPGVFNPPGDVNQDKEGRFASRDLAIVHTKTGFVLASVDARDSFVSLWLPQPDGNFQRIPGPELPGTFPVRIVSGDLNGDGRDDLVIADANKNNVFICLQDATGHFGRTPDYRVPVGASPSDIALITRTDDSRKDVVVTNQFSGDLSVLLNDKAHPFASRLRFRAGAGLHGFDKGSGVVHSSAGTNGVVAGRFDESDVTDLIVTDTSSNTFSLLRGTADGGFLDPSPSSTVATGLRPTAVVAGRFSNGPHLDLAILNEGDNDISIFLGDGHGRFTAGQKIPLTSGSAATGLALRDVDGDGNLDLLVGNEFGDVLLLLGQGDGTFKPIRGNNVVFAVAKQDGSGADAFVIAVEAKDLVRGQGLSLPQASSNPISAPSAVDATHDLDGDGIPDIVVANSGGNDVLVYLNSSNGGFEAPRSFPVGTDPVSITIQDLNGDGIPDLVVANKGSNDVSILLGQGRREGWTLIPGPRLKAGAGPVSTAVADFTGHGILDILVSNSQSNNLYLLPGVGGGFFNDQIPLVRPTPRGPGMIVLLSPPASGVAPPVVVVDPGSDMLTFFSDFASGPGVDVLSGGSRPLVALAIPDDHTTDLLVANNGDGAITFLRGGPDGFSAARRLFGIDLQHPTDLALAGRVTTSSFPLYAIQEQSDQVQFFQAFLSDARLPDAFGGVQQNVVQVFLPALPGSNVAIVATLLTVSVGGVAAAEDEINGGGDAVMVALGIADDTSFIRSLTGLDGGAAVPRLPDLDGDADAEGRWPAAESQGIEQDIPGNTPLSDDRWHDSERGSDPVAGMLAALSSILREPMAARSHEQRGDVATRLLAARPPRSAGLPASRPYRPVVEAEFGPMRGRSPSGPVAPDERKELLRLCESDAELLQLESASETTDVLPESLAAALLASGFCRPSWDRRAEFAREETRPHRS